MDRLAALIMRHPGRVSPEGAAEPGAAGAAGAGRGQQPPAEVVAETQQLRPHRQRRGLHLRPLLSNLLSEHTLEGSIKSLHIFHLI